MRLSTSLLAVSMTVSVLFAGSAYARDYISVVGSSTVYPFATVVAERFGRASEFKTPKVEPTGSGGGLKLFCSGFGLGRPDVANASRRIKKSEQNKCAKNGINDIIEIKIGYDGIAVANSRKVSRFGLTLKQIFMALAKDVPDAKTGKLIPNPYKTWRDVDAGMPGTRIEVLGPPPTSGTRDAFVELAMGNGARQFADLEKLRKMKAHQADKIKTAMKELGIPLSAYDAKREKKGKPPKGKDIFKAIAYAVREDGAYIEAGENDNLIVRKLQASPTVLGIFGYSFLDQNADKVQGALIEGVAPEFENIADGSYPVSRPLYFYVKRAHVGKVPGIRGYLAEFTAPATWGEEGYLADKGLIPMPAAERKKFADAAKNLTAMEKLK